MTYNFCKKNFVLQTHIAYNLNYVICKNRSLVHLQKEVASLRKTDFQKNFVYVRQLIENWKKRWRGSHSRPLSCRWQVMFCCKVRFFRSLSSRFITNERFSVLKISKIHEIWHNTNAIPSGLIFLITTDHSSGFSFIRKIYKILNVFYDISSSNWPVLTASNAKNV